MRTNKTGRDRRVQARYHINSGSLAVFRRDLSVLPGLVADIGRGGLAFFYHEDENWPANGTELFSLFGSRCSVDNLPLITTYDAEAGDLGHPLCKILAAQKQDSVRIRRRGVKFGALSREQEEDLDILIGEFKHTGL